MDDQLAREQAQALGLHVKGTLGVDLIGDVSVNYACIVKAVNAAGESAASNTVGEFDFALTPGSP